MIHTVHFFNKNIKVAVERRTCFLNMLQNTPTFADRVKGTLKSNLKRPTCLNFRTKANLKRHEIIELLKEINFEPQKLVRVAEMKSRSIDITCKTRQDTLQLYKKLRQIDFVYNIRLYESDNTNVFFRLGTDSFIK